MHGLGINNTLACCACEESYYDILTPAYKS